MAARDALWPALRERGFDDESCAPFWQPVRPDQTVGEVLAFVLAEPGARRRACPGAPSGPAPSGAWAPPESAVARAKACGQRATNLTEWAASLTYQCVESRPTVSLCWWSSGGQRLLRPDPSDTFRDAFFDARRARLLVLDDAIAVTVVTRRRAGVFDQDRLDLGVVHGSLPVTALLALLKRRTRLADAGCLLVADPPESQVLIDDRRRWLQLGPRSANGPLIDASELTGVRARLVPEVWRIVQEYLAVVLKPAAEHSSCGVHTLSSRVAPLPGPSGEPIRWETVRWHEIRIRLSLASTDPAHPGEPANPLSPASRAHAQAKADAPAFGAGGRRGPPLANVRSFYVPKDAPCADWEHIGWTLMPVCGATTLAAFRPAGWSQAQRAPSCVVYAWSPGDARFRRLPRLPDDSSLAALNLPDFSAFQLVWTADPVDSGSPEEPFFLCPPADAPSKRPRLM
jgi:hypothetical protein